jgi:hypothetical protein
MMGGYFAGLAALELARTEARLQAEEAQRQAERQAREHQEESDRQHRLYEEQHGMVIDVEAREVNDAQALPAPDSCAHCSRHPGDPAGPCDWMECPV